MSEQKKPAVQNNEPKTEPNDEPKTEPNDEPKTKQNTEPKTEPKTETATADDVIAEFLKKSESTADVAELEKTIAKQENEMATLKTAIEKLIKMGNFDTGTVQQTAQTEPKPETKPNVINFEDIEFSK